MQTNDKRKTPNFQNSARLRDNKTIKIWMKEIWVLQNHSSRNNSFFFSVAQTLYTLSCVGFEHYKYFCKVHKNIAHHPTCRAFELFGIF